MDDLAPLEWNSVRQRCMYYLRMLRVAERIEEDTRRRTDRIVHIRHPRRRGCRNQMSDARVEMLTEFARVKDVLRGVGQGTPSQCDVRGI